MKHLLLALLLAALASAAALADTPAKITEDYHRQADAALAKLNDTLEKATTPLIAALIKAGDTAGAGQLTEQLKAKTTGQPVPTPHASATLLFAQYDQARSKTLEPAQKAAISRIDAMLAGKEGRDLATVTELGKVREEVNGGKAAPVADSGTTAAIPTTWEYYSDPSMTVVNGHFIWNPDGTVALKGTHNNTTPGKWQATDKPHVFKVVFVLGNKTEEECELRVRGKEAELVRPVGTRYLKAQ